MKRCSFGKPDKIPLMPGFPRESTLERWRKEGLPSGDNWYGFLLKEIGVTGEPDSANPDLGISFKMMPEFEEKVLEHKDGHCLVQDWMGAGRPGGVVRVVHPAISVKN